MASDDVSNVIQFPVPDDKRRACANCQWYLPHNFRLGLKLPPGAMLTIGIESEVSIQLMAEFECPDCGEVFHVKVAVGEKELKKR